jgi:two-component system, NtrC family, sensor kinase
MSRLIEAAGFEVITATDFTTALDVIYSDREFHLLLTDIRMPIGQPHGFALARMARQKRGGLPILYLTGLLDIPEPERDAAYGKILAKPISPEELLREVRAAVARGR